MNQYPYPFSDPKLDEGQEAALLFNGYRKGKTGWYLPRDGKVSQAETERINAVLAIDYTPEEEKAEPVNKFEQNPFFACEDADLYTDEERAEWEETRLMVVAMAERERQQAIKKASQPVKNRRVRRYEAKLDSKYIAQQQKRATPKNHFLAGIRGR